MAANLAIQRPPWELHGTMREEIATNLSNRSAAYFEAGDYMSALVDAELVIQLKKQWSKGYFRKAKALVKLDQLYDAKETVLAGLVHEPENLVRGTSFTTRELLTCRDDRKCLSCWQVLARLSRSESMQKLAVRRMRNQTVFRALFLCIGEGHLLHYSRFQLYTSHVTTFYHRLVIPLHHSCKLSLGSLLVVSLLFATQYMYS